MILADKTIKKLLKEGRIVVEPEAVVKTASIRLHLSDQFAKPRGEIKTEKEYLLPAKELILSATLERVKLPDDLAGLYDGSTTLARVGITSHMGSMLMHPGSDGNLTLEIFNASDEPFLLKAGMRIGQLLIAEMDTACEETQPERSVYKGKKHRGLVLADEGSIYKSRESVE